jgi:hypothetical protein
MGRFWLFVASAVAVSSAALAAQPDESNWITLRAGNAFTLRAPPSTTFKPEQGIDSFVGAFENPKFEIEFDYGAYSDTLERFRNEPAVHSEQIVIDGRKALFVSGPDKDGGCALFTAAYVSVAGQAGHWPNTALEIGGCAGSPETVETLRAIFQTIKFQTP